MELRVYLPDDVAEYKEDLELAMTLMVRKLYMNRHKGWAGPNSGEFLNKLVQGIHSEFTELRVALEEEDQMSSVMEAIDVANMGVLTAVLLMRMTREDYDKVRQG